VYRCMAAVVWDCLPVALVTFNITVIIMGWAELDSAAAELDSASQSSKKKEKEKKVNTRRTCR